MADTATHAPSPPTTFSRWIPSIPTMFNPFTNEHQSSERPRAGDDVQTSTRPPILPTTSWPDDSAHSGPPSPSRSSFFAEPPPSSTQSDRGSPEGSVDGKRSKKSRAKTNYSVCHPPPESKARQKLHRRPRSLLQLHRLSDHRRPLPAFDVIPSANVSMRMHSAVGKVFRSRHGICPNDLVVLQAEKYGSDEDDVEINGEEARNVVGLICKGARKDDSLPTSSGRRSPRILMAASGEEWEAKVLSSGAYEFFSPDSHGLGQTVRWVPKRYKDGSNVGRDGLRRFNFSTISPNTRRHPIIASLSKTALVINDEYRLPDPAAGTPMGTPKKSSSSPLDAVDHDDRSTLQQVYTPDQPLRDLITLTAIWVTFKEGWSASQKFEDMPGSAPPSAPASPSKPFHTVSHGHVPSLSSLQSVGQAPGSPKLTAKDRTGSMKAFGSDIIRRTSLLGKSGKKNSTITTSDDGHDVTLSRNSSIAGSVTAEKRTGRTRADSSSTVLVHRAASNRRKNNQLAKEILGDGALEEVSASREGGRPSIGKGAGEEGSSEEEDQEEAREEAKERVSSVDKKVGSESDTTTEKLTKQASVEVVDGKKGKGRKEKKVKVDKVKGDGAVKKGLKRLFCGSK